MQVIVTTLALALVAALLGGLHWFFTAEVDRMDPEDEDEDDDFDGAMMRWSRLEGIK